MKKPIKRAIVVLAALLTLLLILGAVYVSDFYHADESAMQAAAQMSETVQTLQDGNVLSFVPKEQLAGLIFYPGGKVQAEAYAPLMQLCAENGILCALTKMPANLAVLHPNAADGIQEQYPQIESWYIGGHSLGGAMAASYACKHADAFDGIILLAAYSTSDLSATQLRALSIYGTEDRILNRDTYEKNRTHLPAGYEEVVLEGGCHASFGCYGAQAGDGLPTLTPQEQMEQTAERIARFVCN